MRRYGTGTSIFSLAHTHLGVMVFNPLTVYYVISDPLFPRLSPDAPFC